MRIGEKDRATKLTTNEASAIVVGLANNCSDENLSLALSINFLQVSCLMY
jgi:hypothetical protein